MSVVLDRTSSTLYTSDGLVTQVPDEAILQQPSNVTDTVTLAELDGGKTRMTATGTFLNQEDRDGMVQAGMERGAGESYDRLEALLATMQ